MEVEGESIATEVIAAIIRNNKLWTIRKGKRK